MEKIQVNQRTYNLILNRHSELRRQIEDSVILQVQKWNPIYGSAITDECRELKADLDRFEIKRGLKKED